MLTWEADFDRWGIKDGFVHIHYKYNDGDHGSHAIPIEFFEIEDVNEAIKAYKIYKENLVLESRKKESENSKEKRRQLYELLKREFSIYE
jgi:hypothetical protein